MKLYTITDTTDLENVKLIFLTHHKNIKKTKFDNMLFDVMLQNPNAKTVEQIANLMVSTHGFYKIRDSQMITGDIRATGYWVEQRRHTQSFYFLLNGYEVLTVDVNDITYPDVQATVLATLEEYTGGIPVLQELPGDNAALVPVENPEHPELIGCMAFPIKGMVPIETDGVILADDEQQLLRERFLYLINQINEPLDIQINRANEIDIGHEDFDNGVMKYEYPVVIELIEQTTEGKIFKFTFPDLNYSFTSSPDVKDIASFVNAHLSAELSMIIDRGDIPTIPSEWYNIPLNDGQQISVAVAKLKSHILNQSEEIHDDENTESSVVD